MHKYTKYVFVILFIFILTILSITVFNIVNFTDFSSPKQVSYLIFKSLGLTGICLLFFQVVLGSNMSFFIKIFGGKIFKFHVAEGIFTYCIILLHPIFYTVYNSLSFNIFYALGMTFTYFSFDEWGKYLVLGKLGLILLTLAVAAGVFRNSKIFINHWRKFHVLNYLVLSLIIMHSLGIGNDTKLMPFTILYPFFIAAVVWGLFHKYLKHHISFTSTP